MAGEDDDFCDPFDMLGGMGEEEVYKVSLVEEASPEGSAAAPAEGAAVKAAEASIASADASLPQALRDFLRSSELFLLDVDAATPPPAAPANVNGVLEAECAALAALLPVARGGDFATLLAAPLLEPLAVVLAGWRPAAEGSVPAFHAELRTAVSTLACGDADGSTAAVRRLLLLATAVASLHLYLRANWTGPPAADHGPFGLDDSKDPTPAEMEILEALEVDGEPAYEMLVGAGYLWLALELLGVLPGSLDSTGAPRASTSTAPIWRARAAFVWQLSLAEASERGLGQSPQLFGTSICELVGEEGRSGALCGPGLMNGGALEAVQTITAPVLKSWKRRSAEDEAEAHLREQRAAREAQVCAAELSQAPGRVRAALIVELNVRLCWYSRTKPFDGVKDKACEAAAFDYEVTGVMGTKRVYQHTEFAQLMVKARHTDNAHVVQSRSGAKSKEDGASGTTAAAETEGAAPGNLTLLEVDDMTDVMEAPKLSASLDDTEREQLEKPLTSTEQAILLSRCQYLWVSGNPNDELMLQEVNALAQRVLATEQKEQQVDDADGPLLTANWLNFSCGLWYRCKAEHHRNKTRERAAFQLQSLVDQFKDEKPSAAHRLLAVHSCGYPARFHQQREMGMRMMRMGMVSTAHEQFKKLRMWPDAVDCLMIAERNVEAIEMVKELLEQSPTPRLWCCLGDLEKEPKHFEKAWEVSKHRFARAQRALGRHYFEKEQLDKAVDCLKLALDINPLHAGVWFTMGVGQMRLQRWEDAVQTFTRCLGIEDENSECWGNLAAVHSQRGNLVQARACMSEACKRARESWKMWESFQGICMQLRDIQGVIQALRRLTELSQGARVSERVLGMLTMAVVSDAKGLYNNTTGKAFSNQLNDLFRFMADKSASRSFVWGFWAHLQDSRGERHAALDNRLKQNRAAQAQLWEERDPEVFTSALEDLRECLEVIGETLQEPMFKEVAAQQLQPFVYSLKDVAKRLKEKVEAPGGSPASWKQELAKITGLAEKLSS